MIRLFLFAVFALILLSPGSMAFAQQPKAEDMTIFRKSETVSLDPDQGYLLVRSRVGNAKFIAAPILLRRLSDDEMARYEADKASAFEASITELKADRAKALSKKAAAEAKGRIYKNIVPPEPTLANFNFDYDGVDNVYYFRAKDVYEKDGDHRTLFAAMPPGTYILASTALGASSGPCFCMGTVEFEVKPGVITDLGYLLMDQADRIKKPSPFPEVRELVDGHGIYKAGVAITETVLLPMTDNMPVPQMIADWPREAPTLQAVGKMPNYFSTFVTRLGPIEGVLSYDRDVVIDARTGLAVPNINR